MFKYFFVNLILIVQTHLYSETKDTCREDENLDSERETNSNAVKGYITHDD